MFIISSTQKLFRGRINRKYYFFGVLLFSILSAVITVVLGAMLYGYSFAGGYVGDAPIRSTVAIIFVTCFLIACLFVLFTLHARRLHDIGFSGWFALFMFIPYVSFLIPIVLFFIPGDIQENKYGPVFVKQKNFLKTIINY